MSHVLSEEEIKHDNVVQLREAFSDDNFWFAGERLGRSPTKEEAVRHYVQHGGSEYYRQRNSRH